jgi:peptide chain release factor 1
VPPTERRGRVHTSTVTVAVLDQTRDVDPRYSQISDTDFRVEWFSGSGAGGQHRNKHQNSCRVIHTPTGLLEARQGRKRENNYREAKDALLARLEGAAHGEAQDDLSADRKAQVGSGMRGDKSVTIRFQDDRVQHHGTGRSMSASKYMKGHMDELWN